MESSIPSLPTPKPKLTTLLLISRRLIKSHLRRFSPLFLGLFFISLLSQTSSFSTSVRYLVPGGDIAQFFTVRVFLISLVDKIFNHLVAISVTSVALQSFNGKSALSMNSVANSISSSFFPVVATNLLQVTISLLAMLGFAMIFVCVLLSAFLLGFPIDPHSQFAQLLVMGLVAVPSLLVGWYLYVVSWGIVTAVIVAESTWGSKALKRSKSLVNGNRLLAVIMPITFAVLYFIVDWISVAGSDESKRSVTKVFRFVAQLVVTSMVKLYETVAYALFYVFCKAVHEEGIYRDSQYVKLATNDTDRD